MAGGRGEIPLVKGRPLVGNLAEFRADRLGLFRRAYQEHGELARVRILRRELLVATSPQLAQEVLVKQAASFVKFEALARFARPMLGNGLVTAAGEYHRRQRRLIAPGFKPRRIAQYGETMARLTEEAVARWLGQGRLDVGEAMTRLTLAIAAETMFNTAAEAHAKAAGAAIHEVTDYVATSLMRPFHIPFGLPTPRNLRLRRAVGALERIVYGIIRARRQSGERPDDILSMLLDAQDETDGTGLTDAQVRDEVMTLFVAGHETTANALSWCTYLLARHPDIAERLANESRAVLGGRPPAVDDLARLPYAKQVFLEAMRLYPPVYLVGRESTQPVVLDGWDVPARATVIVSIYGLHHREDLCPDPERFDPDRFETAREQALPRGAYIPFADGPRVCIGGHFAVMEGQIVLAHMAQHVRLGRHDGPPVAAYPRVTLRPSAPIVLDVTRR